MEICRSSFQQGNGVLTHFGYEASLVARWGKLPEKKTRFEGLFFRIGLGPVLPLGQWLPSKPWPERSTFLYSTYINCIQY